MSRQFRLWILILLAATLPLRSWANTSMLFCAGAHGVAAAFAEAPPVNPQDHSSLHEAGAAHAGHDMHAAMTDADDGNEPGAAPCDDHATGAGGHGSCSFCGACSVGAAAAPAMPALRPAPPAAMPIPFAAPHYGDAILAPALRPPLA